jgi:Secretion system C-terminal sorting domain
MKKTKTQLLLLLCGAFIPGLQAQEAVLASGGNASGSGGSASYTVGQVAYTSHTGSGGEVNLGVQQAFEIYALGVDHFPKISLSMSVYPNPTADYVILKTGEYALENLAYQLFDLTGKQITNQKITNNETKIPMEGLAISTYLLKVSAKDNAGQSIIKTFKINKNK